MTLIIMCCSGGVQFRALHISHILRMIFFLDHIAHDVLLSFVYMLLGLIGIPLFDYTNHLVLLYIGRIYSLLNFLSLSDGILVYLYAVFFCALQANIDN
jgi:hypothetical protein